MNYYCILQAIAKVAEGLFLTVTQKVSDNAYHILFG